MITATFSLANIHVKPQKTRQECRLNIPGGEGTTLPLHSACILHMMFLLLLLIPSIGAPVTVQGTLTLLYPPDFVFSMYETSHLVSVIY